MTEGAELLRGPGHAVGVGTGVDVAYDFQRLQIEHGDGVVGGAGDVGPGAVGLDEDAGSAVTDGDAGGDGAGFGVEHDEVAAVKGGDENTATVERELKAVGAVDVGLERGDHLFRGIVDDRDGAVLGVGYPDLFAVRREIEAFGAVADLDHCFIPVLTLGHAGGWSARATCAGGRWGHVDDSTVEQAHRAGVDVGGDEVFAPGGDVDHVGAVLAGAEDEVDAVGGGVVTANGFRTFGGEPDLAVDKGEAVRAVERAEIDAGLGCGGREVDDGEGVEGAEAVVRDVGGAAVG